MRDFEGALFSTVTPITIRTSAQTSVSIILTVDNIAQEGIEHGTLRLVLAPEFQQPIGTFFRRDLAVTINDTSSE